MSKTIIYKKYNERIGLALEELKRRKYDADIISLTDEGFADDNVISAVFKLIYGGREMKLLNRAVAFRNLKLPEGYDIILKTHYGIYEGGTLRGRVKVVRDNPNLNTESVDWYYEDGSLYRKDLYNKYGYKFSSIMYRNNEKVLQSYYDETMKEIVHHDCKSDKYIINRDGNTEIIDSTEEFYRFLIGQTGHAGDIIDLDEVIGDMHIANCPNTDDDSRELRKSVFILTCTDNLEGIEKIISDLNDFDIYIAANTQVSDKLIQLEQYENVRVIPQISREDRQILFGECSFYLDISHGAEIFDAIYTAHVSGTLVLGFGDTVVDARLVNPDCIIADNNCEKLTDMIRSIASSREMYEAMYKKQEEIVNCQIENERL